MQRKRFVIDTNVFIAVFKSGYATTTKLLLRLLLDPEVEIVADYILLEEYKKWINILTSELPKIRERAGLLYRMIQAKVEIEEPGREHIEAVKPYMPESEAADVYHATACLKVGSMLITIDKDFQDLKNKGIIEV